MPSLSVPLSLLQFPGYFTDLDGAPLAGGKLAFVEAGTTTPAAVYHDVNGDSAWTDPVELDSSGFAQIFLQPILYDVTVSDADDVELYTVEGIGNPGQIVAASSGNIQAQGSKSVSSGYSILSTDNLVTTDPGAGSAITLQLPAASARSSTDNGNGLALIILNLAAQTCTVNPDGADTINGLASITIAAGSSPTFHYATFYSDGASAWYALAA